MALYLIGIGLGNEKDITLRGLEAIKKCDSIFLESYTSKMNCEIGDLEKLYGKKVIIADRNLAENKAEEIIKEAKTKNVAFLVIGDVFSATTHQNFSLEAKNFGVDIKIIHNASIFTAIGEIGLDLYKFGRTVSIPMDNKNITSPVKFLKENLKLGLHTLVLLDMVPLENISNQLNHSVSKGGWIYRKPQKFCRKTFVGDYKFLGINAACDYLIRNKISKSTLAIGCAAIGSDDSEIKAGSIEELSKVKFSRFPQCIVIPGKLHFIEEEMIGMWRRLG